MRYLALLLICFCLPTFVYSETILLKSGKQFNGTILSETDSEVEIQLDFGKIKIARDQIDTISSSSTISSETSTTSFPEQEDNYKIEIVSKEVMPSEEELEKQEVKENPEDEFDITYLGKTFINQLKNLHFDDAVKSFDPKMKKAMPSDKLQAVWKDLITNNGSLKQQTSVRKEPFNEYTIVFITCVFKKTTLDAKIVFNSEKQIAGLYFVESVPPVEYEPPKYVHMDKIKEKEILVGNDEWKLPGGLTYPKEGGPFPVVVLVHGSGPHNRDESIGPNRPFRDLAWGLASEGVAVLRYTKRTKQYAKEIQLMSEKITVKEETIDDVLRAVITLRNEDEVNINKDKIFVLGHSMGGMLIPRIGVHDQKNCRFYNFCR